MSAGAIAMQLRDKLHPDVHAALFRIVQTARDHADELGEKIDRAAAFGQFEVKQQMAEDRCEILDALVFFEEVRP